MVPCSGPSSNPQSPLLKEWNRNSKNLPNELDALCHSADIDKLFDTLAEWNTYLENHVKGFKECQKEIEEREP